MIELSAEDRAAIEQIRRDWDRAYLSTSKLDAALFLGGLRAGLERGAKVCEDRADANGNASDKFEASWLAAAIRALLEPK